MLRTAALLALLSAAAQAPAQPQRYELDPVHTRVLFAVTHAGFSHALGTISGSTGKLAFDPSDWRNARVEVEVPLAKLDLGDPDWNAAVLGRRLLRAEAYPRARFISTSVTPRDQTHARVCGNLSLRGTTAPLCLEVTLNALERHPMPPFRHTVGFSATGTLDRRAFGIDAWEGLIGDTVELRIEAEAVRRREDAPGTEAAEAEAPEAEAPQAEAPATDTPAGEPPPPRPSASTPTRPT